VPTLPWSLAVSLLSACVAAITDLRTRTIPNWLTLPLPMIGLVGHGILSGAGGLWEALLGCLLCFVPAYFLFARGALGGGDVKLFAALGSLLGAREGLELELTAFCMIACFAVWSTAWNGRLWALLRASFYATLHLLWPARFPRQDAQEVVVEMPMGGAILCAVVALCLRSYL
jgi:prepilin peptidase CpaA